MNTKSPFSRGLELFGQTLLMQTSLLCASSDLIEV